MLLIFVANNWLNDKEIRYDVNNICRIQSRTEQHWCLYLCWLYAPHWLLGSWKGLKNHIRIRLCIKRTRHWWTSWICKIISWWKFADVGRCGRFIRTMVIFSNALMLAFFQYRLLRISILPCIDIKYLFPQHQPFLLLLAWICKDRKQALQKNISCFSLSSISPKYTSPASI